MQLPAKQEKGLELVDPDLARWYRVVYRILKGACRFDGARTIEESLANMKAGTSRVKNPRSSEHVIWEGRPKARALDIYPTGKHVTSKMINDPKTYDPIRAAAKLASEETGVKVFNGAERWNGFDNPHFQLEDA